MKIEQQVRGSKPNQDTFVGAEGQLTVDIDNWDIRLHDGVTPGGKSIINRDNGDERWQAKSVELAGIAGFQPSQRGMLTRLGSGIYRVRKFEFNADQVTILYPDGYGGNPYFSINTRIETDHIFGGDLIIEGVLQVDGGINGDTAGTHNGPVVGDVTGDVAGNITGNLTGNTTGLHTGALDVRGESVQFDDGQIPLAALDGLEDYVKANAVPMGVILIWSGDETDVPDGWYLCNGLNGTPDLRDKFVLGAGSLSHPAGDVGGTLTHTHATSVNTGGAHSHTGTVGAHTLTTSELPSHNHPNGVTDSQTGEIFCYGSAAAAIAGYDLWGYTPGSGVFQGLTGPTGGALGHSHTLTVDSGGSHTHTLNNPAGDNVPPYYALCYIMRAP